MNPQNPLDPSITDDTAMPSGPQPGQSIEPTVSAPDESASLAFDVSDSGVGGGAPAPTTLDSAAVESDPSPLDGPTTSMPQPDAFQPDFLNETDETMTTPEPASEPMAPPAQPEPVAPAPVTVTVEQQPAAQNNPGQSVPSFLSQPKPAEPMAPAPQPSASPAPAAQAADTPGLPPVIVHAGKKSRLWIVIVLLVLLLVGGGAAAYFLVLKKDKPTDSSNTSDTSQNSTTDDSKDNSNQSSSTSKPAVTAEYSSELDGVCNGSPISNVATYTDNKSAVIYAFYNKPGNEKSWTSSLVGYGKSYYPDDVTDVSTVNVIACLNADAGSVGSGITCDYTDSKDQKVSVSYKSLKYELKFYNAKTAEQIGDAQTIDAPAADCPSFITYDAETKTAYASPDDGALEAAFDAFVK